MPTAIPCSSPAMPDPAPATAAALLALRGEDRSAAWERLAAWHGAEVWRLIRSRVADPGAAEDAYQDFWIRLPQAAARYAPDAAGGERSARAWLMRVAYTTALNRERDARARLRRRRPIAGAAEEAGMDAATPTYPPELVARVGAAMAGLAERHRRPLLLRLVAGLSYEELAADLGCSVNNARVKVHRALEHLRARLGAEDRRLPETALAGLLVPVALAPPALPPLPAAAPAAAAGTGIAAPALLAAGGLAVVGAAVAVAVASGGSAPPPPPAAPAVIVLDDFERDDPGMGAGANRPCELSIVAAPPGGGSGRALSLAWPGAHAAWLDGGYRRARPFPAGIPAPGAAAEVVLQAWLPAGGDVRYLAVRCHDARGETFEWRSAPFAPGAAGWRTVRIAVDPAAPAGRWGGAPGDGRADLPLSLLGYAVVLADAAVPAGAVLIDAVGVAAPPVPP